MSYDAIPAFVSALHQREAVAALTLEFTILTAARTGEVIGAKWDEVDLEKAIWTIPAMLAPHVLISRSRISACASTV